MKILEYVGLDPARVRAQYRKVCAAIERDDFRQAEVKKLAADGRRPLYRAKLDDSNRLLFTLLRHGGERYALMLEVIENHAYEKSRFLRGATIDEARIPVVDDPGSAEAETVRYIHPQRREIHLLDKVISFDDAQHEIFGLPAPLVIVGSAGSGKTALTLEKLRGIEGEVLYVTRSAYLAQNARDLYYHDGYDDERQEATFLSYREFVESLRVPPGREVQWRDFVRWFARQQQAFRGIAPHHAFEEIEGVLAADPDGPLDRAAYLALGVRQSIFVDDRDRVFDLFERYRAWLDEAKLYDPGLIAPRWLEYAAPRYDFIVIDEVQDLTTSQLALILATLKKPGQFLLCGDSNQIVHPNFFSWSRVKSLFWRDAALAERQELRVLRANFRNSREATRVANTLLKIKQQRFGSIDRESNFLVDSVGGDEGAVTLVADKDAVKKDLDQRIRQSTHFAVLVMRDEDKDEARKHFRTPLLFSVHEAKGLEYESIVLYRFVSGNRTVFADITDGVEPADLEAAELDYRRARDKTDKSLELHKFFVNALYVALTRAVRNLYLIESDTGHPLFDLLGLRTGEAALQVDAKASSLDEWQKEARKLELQGKQEQADAIRTQILRQTPVPWPVFDEARLRDTLVKVFREKTPGNKAKKQLLEYAACHDEPKMTEWLATEAQYSAGSDFDRLRDTLGRKYSVTYASSRFKDILQACDRHGVDHRTPMNLTPLMAAASTGNVALVDALVERGADLEATDHLGRNALHWALLEAFRDPKYAQGPFAGLYQRLAPAAIDLKTRDERLVRIGSHLSEYLLVQTMWALFKSRFTMKGGDGIFDTAAILEAWEHLPAQVLRPERKRRPYLSGLLSRNEVDRDYAYNRRLFRRLKQGSYQFDPALAVRRRVGVGVGVGEAGTGVGAGAGAGNGNDNGSEAGVASAILPDDQRWVPVMAALNLPLIAEGASLWYRSRIESLLASAGMPAIGEPIGGQAERHRLGSLADSVQAVQREDEARYARRASDKRRAQASHAAQVQAPAPGPAQAPAQGSAQIPAQEPVPEPQNAPEPRRVTTLPPAKPPPWGTPAAKRYEIERIRREIEARRLREAGSGQQGEAGDERNGDGPPDPSAMEN